MMMNTLARTVGRRAFTAVSQRNASTLVVADLDGSTVGASTLSAVTAAGAIGGDCTVLAVGDAAAATACGTVDGVSKVLHAATDAYVGGETVAAAIAAAMGSGSYTHIIAASSNLGKNAIPRAAAKAGASPVTDVIEVHGEDTFVRPMYAGNALAKVKNSDAVKVRAGREERIDDCILHSSIN